LFFIYNKISRQETEISNVFSEDHSFLMGLLHQEITESTNTIDVSILQNGVYSLKIVGGRGVQVGKFIKN